MPYSLFFGKITLVGTYLYCQFLYEALEISVLTRFDFWSFVEKKSVIYFASFFLIL